jgi:hypothetical protein
LVQNVTCSIKFVDPQLKSDDVVVEVTYLIEDLRDLEGMSQIRFEPISEIRGTDDITVGIKFEFEFDRLVAMLRRLRDRLYYNPIETWFLFQISDIGLQIDTHRADDLIGLMAAARSGLLFYPERDYLAEAETYSRTQGELSPTELDNLNLLRQRLDISTELAEVLNTIAASPYQTLAEKRRHFEETTQAEISRLKFHHDGQPIAPKDIWPVLQELAENLILPTSEATAIYQTHWQHYQDEIRVKTEQVSAQTTADERLAADAEAERQRQAQQAQEQRDQYRDLCCATMADDIYPSEYDQGRLDQARRLRGIPIDEAIQIEAAVRDQLYGSVGSEAGVDYTRLRHCLHQQAWEEADLETEIAILAAIKQDQQPLTVATVSHLPAVDLATIDALWSRYSQGKFGFKAQQQVYRSQQQIQPDEKSDGWDFTTCWGGTMSRPGFIAALSPTAI